MTILKLITILAAAGTLAACDAPKQNKTVDRGIDSKHLSQLKAGIWVDPEGCDHWIIDDGAEGYMSSRRYPDGRPVCTGKAGTDGYVTGPYKAGSNVPDPV
ncbi:hypothetical protein GVY41_14835 [Frigidibacter albus]|uniref:Lipoprotein n=1 Tax=Frigidibacter albus TaxID=1465486 RepID=A0A6L8VKH9_9RHOB|nr:hypothetical protein [Frigidibacter albus]MZQ90226.1 hypothetical protein [Frigidibacter albus]NBE32276.1 hypothetical protein [Frigidibacter albus]GGH58235.1 hypothetical protein GCM10011341_28430 [Frigidibacter albus]